MSEPTVLTGDVDRASAARGAITFVGTATVLARVGGFVFLTDPNFLHQGQHAKLGYGLRSRRLTDPALEIAALPALDFVVLSHHHGDHFDEVAAEQLPKSVPIITGRHAARKLRRQGFTAPVALATWDQHRVSKGAAAIDITALPGKHAPQPLQTLLPPVIGTMLDVSHDHERLLRLYITGDTLFHDGLGSIAERFPGIDLCIIHLGGTKIAGILLTMDAEQGVKALRLVRPARAIPVHYDDYTVFKSSLDDFRRAAAQANLETEVVYVERGETYEFTCEPR